MSLSDMLLQLVSISRNFRFFFKTERALSDEGFINSLRDYYPSEKRKIRDILVLIHQAFSLSSALCNLEQEKLGFSFSNDDNDTFFKFRDACLEKPAVPFQMLSRTPIRGLTLFLKVHLDVCLFCGEKLQTVKTDYFSNFPKKYYHIYTLEENISTGSYGSYEEKVIKPYVDNGLTLSEFDPLIDVLCTGSYLSPGEFHIEKEGFFESPEWLSERDLLGMAALLGLERVFRGLVLCQAESLQENLEEISTYAVWGGHPAIVRMCEDKDSCFGESAHIFPSCFNIALNSSRIGILHLLLRNHPNCTQTYRYFLYSLGEFLRNGGPVTAAKTDFLLEAVRQCLPIKDTNFGGYFSPGCCFKEELCLSAIKYGIMPIAMYLIETGAVSLNHSYREFNCLRRKNYGYPKNETLFGDILEQFCSGDYSLLNVDVVKYLIERGGDPSVRITVRAGRKGDDSHVTGCKVRGKMLTDPSVGGIIEHANLKYYDRYETNLFQFACANNDLEFAHFLMDHGLFEKCSVN
jgi:hypothetical protein